MEKHAEFYYIISKANADNGGDYINNLWEQKCEKYGNAVTSLPYNEQIFELKEDYFNNSYVQLCISSNNINKAKYVEYLKELKTTYINANIRLHIIDDDTNVETLKAEGFNTNIETYIESNIPAHLLHNI